MLGRRVEQRCSLTPRLRILSVLIASSSRFILVLLPLACTESSLIHSQLDS